MTRRHPPVLALVFVLGISTGSAAHATVQETPTTDSVTLWLASSAIQLRTVEAGSGFADMQPLRDVVGDARIVALGEPTHGNREVYQLKHRMLEFLVKALGFSVFVLETPMPESFDVSEYIQTGTGDAANALAGTHVWPWDTEEVLELIEWMRRYNADSANSRKLTFYGFDMQSPERAAKFTLGYLDKVDPLLAAAAREKLGRLAIPISDPDAWGYRPIVPDETSEAVRAAVDSMLKTFDARADEWIEATSADEWALARQHARVLGQWIEANRDDGRRYGAVRDSAMAENIRWIMEREGAGARIVVSAHNSHVADATARHRDDGSDWAGRHLRRMFGDDLVIFGFLFNQGGFAAIDAAMPSRGLRSFSVGPAPEGTAEAVFQAAGLDLAVVDLRPIPHGGAVDKWFEVPRPTRNSWGGYDLAALGDFFFEYVLPEAFDALIFVDSTTAVRAVSPLDYRLPATLPAPANVDFEAGRSGQAPERWFVWSKLRRFGFEVAASEEQPYSGSRSAMIRRQSGEHYGETSGSLLQSIDASAYRGRRIRLRAAARAELVGDGLVFVRLRIHPPDSSGVHDLPDVVFDSLDEYRVTSPEWRVYEIETEVPQYAAAITYGLFLAGAGTAWMDAVSLEVVKD